jgi:glyoxylase-like metal-dependent hydrolase (beta-lactamase superfamily II)
MNGTLLRTNRGSLGFCNVTLIEDEGHFILFDTGNYGDRVILLEAFQRHKIDIKKIKYVILSHLHWDHCMNISLFPEATIILSSKELDYGKKVVEGSIIDNDYPIEIVEHLINKSKYLAIENTYEISPNLLIFETPGHTIGSISLHIKNGENPMVVAGDAVVTGEDFKSGESDIICLNSSIPKIKESIDKIKNIGKIIIPAHGLPFWNVDNEVKYIGDFKLIM